MAERIVSPVPGGTSSLSTGPRINVRRALPLPVVGARRKSVFHITINSNIMPQNEADKTRIVNGLDRYMETVFGTNANMEAITQFAEGTGHWDDAYIEETDVNFAIEQGTKQHRIHVHAVVQITHRSYIRLSPAAIARSVQRELGYRPYVYVRGGGDRTFNLREYQRKQQRPATTLTPTNITSQFVNAQ